MTEGAHPRRPIGFNGPLFVVGLSRSGTKLLREVLNRHPCIRIPDRESYFIPQVLRHFSERRGPPNAHSRKVFIRQFKRGVFYNNMCRRGRYLSNERLAQLTERNSWTEIIEGIFRYYTGPEGGDYLWGDKTPKYLNHLVLLRDHFPQARFLHIYRDPRDRVISANQAWGANIYLSAQQWLDAMQGASQQALVLESAYKMICYEKLIVDPETTAREICEFLELPYYNGMTRLQSPVEGRGDTSHPTRTEAAIVADNMGQFRSILTPVQLARIEQIVFPYAAQLGYRREAGVQPHRGLTTGERLRYCIPHYFGALHMLTRNWGVFRGINYALARWRV